jgi:hypothetical protein
MRFSPLIEVLEARIAPAAAFFDLSSLDGSTGFKLSGNAANDYSGTRLDRAGDINGDGFDDLIIGGALAGTDDRGEAYVLFGKASGFNANLNLAAIDGSNGFKVTGAAADDFLGIAVSAAGDVNGDGLDDIIIGASRADANGANSGASYVIFGRTSGFAANLNVSTLNGGNGFKLSGGAAGDDSGSSVGASDVNGDGFSDLIIGAHFASPNGSSSGASYVVFGKATSFAPNLNLSTLNGSDGFKLSGAVADDNFGLSVNTAGDVNGDGFEDVIFGASSADPSGDRSGASYVVFGKASGFPANLNVSALDGSNGFKLSGVTAGDTSGRPVSTAGDINGDGFGDLILGASYAAPNGLASGASYVIFGKASGFLANLNLSTLNGSNGFRISGAALGDRAGYSVSTAGDFNGDGLDDLIVGARAADPHGTSSGASYLIFGRASGFAADLNLSALDGSNGFRLNGVAAGDASGREVSAAGDVNGDGFDDVIIGASGVDTNGVDSGASYVIFGSTFGPLAGVSVSDARIAEPAIGTVMMSFVVTLSSPSAETISLKYSTSNGTATSPEDYAAASLSTLSFAPGEVSKTVLIPVHANSANEPDETFFLTLSAPTNATLSDAQAVGTIAGRGASFPLASLDGSNGFKISGAAFSDQSGGSVSLAGDINGDGFDDVIIGAAGADLAGNESGASYIVFGRAGFTANLNLSELDGSNGFRIKGLNANDRLGRSVSAAGDINGDGFDDLIVGAPYGSPNGFRSGFSYVIFGKPGAFPRDFDLSTLNGANGFAVSGVATNDYAGRTVGAAGDLNGDGFDDLILGAPEADPNGLIGAGTTYVLFGKATGFAPNLSLSSLNGSNGFRINGAAAGDRSGSSVSGARDVNGDGIADIVIGASGADPNGSYSGASYVVFGTRSGFASSVSLATLNGANGFKLSGVATGDGAARVGGAGDLNGDGFADLVVGAPFADPNGAFSGTSYVVFGKSTGFAPNVNLSALNGTDGFTINGISQFDVTGSSVAGAGDVNGDGFDDLIIGAPDFDSSEYGPGNSFVIYGRESFAPRFDLSALSGLNGFKIEGTTIRDSFGYSVSGAGDVNGDGFDDVIIGAHRADPNGGYSGASYVIFGRGVEVSISDGIATEGDAGTAVLEFTVSLSQAATSPISVQLAALDGSARAGSDFTAPALGTLTFAPGETSKTVKVNVTGDTVFEEDETFSITLSGASGAVIADRTATGTIRNDDAPPVVTIANAALLEGNSGTSTLTFAVSVSAASELPASVQFTGVNGTALAGSDFAALVPGTLTFAPGETVKTITVDVLGDTSIEDHETFSIVLAGATNATLGTTTATGTIFNDDTTVRIADTGGVIEGNEGTRELVFQVSLEKASALPASVQFASVNGTALAGSDFAALVPGTLTFAPGETVKTITVDVLGDTSIEDHETFSIVLAGATNATLGTTTATGTIFNDDTAVRIADAGSVIEGNEGTRELVFQVSLEKASALPVTVNFASVDGTAFTGSDYAALAPGTLTFAPGETTKTILVNVFGDTSIEDHETFSVVLSGTSGAILGTGTAVGTILNDETAFLITAPVRGLEGNAGSSPLIFTIGLAKPSALPVTVSHTTADGTAAAGIDFTAPAVGAQLIFAPGETTKTIEIGVLGDLSIEDHETFSVLLSEAVNAALSVSTIPGTILNDDTAARITGASAREGDIGTAPFDFVVTLEKPSALPVTMKYSTLSGTALAGSDFVAASEDSQVSFAPGETSKIITVNLVGDTEVEAHETFSVVLSLPSNVTLTEGTAMGTILNDDTLIRISDASVLEGHFGTRSLSFTVSLTAPTALPVSVSFTSANGTATAGIDYMAPIPGMLTFAPGETSKTLTVDVLGDTVTEASETLSISLSDAIDAVIDGGTGLGTILNDDVTLVGKRKATFTDEDGELVRITVSKGTLKVEDFTIVPTGLGAQLALIDFSSETAFGGTDVSVTAKASSGAAPGNRLATVGYINATGIDLGSIIIKGDLGQIDAGDGQTERPAIGSLSARLLGLDGFAAQLLDSSLHSQLAGSLKSLELVGGLNGANLSVAGDIGVLKVTGDVRDSILASDGKIGAIKITGDLVGSGPGSMLISARGQLAPISNAMALAIGRVQIGGSVSQASILAGFDASGVPISGDARIGAVVVGLNWSASSLAAGVMPNDQGFYGTDDDALITANGPIVSRIASIVIKGTATGTLAAGDHFGFVAEKIGAFKVGKVKLPLTKGAGNDLAGLLVGGHGDLWVREVKGNLPTISE